MEKQQPVRVNPLKGYLSSPEVSDEDDNVNTISPENGAGQLEQAGLFHESGGLLSDDEDLGSVPALGEASENWLYWDGSALHKNVTLNAIDEVTPFVPLHPMPLASSNWHTLVIDDTDVLPAAPTIIELSDDDTDISLTTAVPESSSSSSSSSSSFPLLPVSSIPTPTVTLHDELFGELLPKLPTMTHNKKKHKHFSHNGNLDFTMLPDHSELGEPEAICHEINITGLRASFYSIHAMVNSADRVMFMIVGDKIHEIYIHSSDHMRSILVLTQTQYDALPTSALSKVDVLVLHEMVSATHGNFNEQLMQTSAQRIAALIFSHHVGLKHFMLANGHIRSIGYHFHQHDRGAKSLFGLLKKRMDNACVIAVSRNYNQEVKKSNLGTGVFMIHMNPIKAALPLPEQMYWLMPQASDAGNWVEVLYFQIFLEQLALEHDTFEGKGIVGRKMLKRKDAAIKYYPSSKRQEDNQTLNSSPLPNLMAFNHALGGEEASDAHYCINQTVEEVNRIIEANWYEYQKRKHRAEEGDLFQYHWDAQRGLPQDLTPIAPLASVSDVRQGQPFVNMFKASLCEMDLSSDRFRPYQRDAIAAVAASEGAIGHLEIPPGCGKTLLTYLLVKGAWNLVNSDETIVVVTPQRNLLNQLFADFSMYYYRWFHDYQQTDTIFTFDRVIKVSSMTNSLSIKALVCNNPIQTHKKILLFCLESFIRYCEQYPEKMSEIMILIADEYHGHCNRFKKIGLFNLTDTFMIGCSATPPIKNPFGSATFKYPPPQAIADGFGAPMIFDYIDVDYSPEAVVDLTEYLPLLLNRYYPGYNELKRLAEIIGIVFLPSREDCDAAAVSVSAKGIKAIAIYTGSEHTLDDIDKVNGGCVIFGVWALRHGYNNPNIAYAVAAQNLYEAKHEPYLLQMMGRAGRISEDPFKIAYGILFKNARQAIPEALRNSPLTVEPHQAYLEQADTYYYPSNDTWVETTEFSHIPQALRDQGRFIRFGVGNCMARLQLPPNAPVRTLAPTSSSSSSLSQMADHVESLPSATTLHDTSSSSQSNTSDDSWSSTPNSPQSSPAQFAEALWSSDTDEQADTLSLSSSSTTSPANNGQDYSPPLLSNPMISTSSNLSGFFNQSQGTQKSRKRLSPPPRAYDDYPSSPDATHDLATVILPQDNSLLLSRYSDNDLLDAMLPSSPVSSTIFSLRGRRTSVPLSDDMLPSSPDAYTLAHRSPINDGDDSLSLVRTPSPPGSPPMIEPPPKYFRSR